MLNDVTDPATAGGVQQTSHLQTSPQRMATPTAAVGVEELEKIYAESTDKAAKITEQLKAIENKQRAAQTAFKKAEKKRKVAAEDLLALRLKTLATGKAAHDKILTLRSVSEATSTNRRLAMELFTRCTDPHKTWHDYRVHCKCHCHAQH